MNGTACGLTARHLTEVDPSGLLVLAALARVGSVRGAAEELGTPRSTVSRRLAELEAQVGAPLAVRTARRFTLTELGSSRAASGVELEAVLERSAELVGRSTREPSGVLRVAIAPVLGEEILPEIVSRLLAKHARLSIEARMTVDYVDLRRGSVDVALRAAALEDATDLFGVRLGASVTGCYVSPAYAAKHGAPTTPAELAHHDCILVGGDPRVSWLFRSGARDVRVAVAGRLRVDNHRVARDAAALGVGVFRAAAVFAAPFVASGALVPVLERHWPRAPIFAVHAGTNPPPPRVRAFIEAARDAVARALPRGEAGAPRWRTA